MRELQELHDLMNMYNTNRIVIKYNDTAEEDLLKNITFKLDTGQNIGAYIEEILGYEFDSFGNTIPILESDLPWWIIYQLNLLFISELGYCSDTINEEYIYDLEKRRCRF